MSRFWDDFDVIHTYTRQEAIEDGVLINASVGDLAEVSQEHYKYPVAMTAAVWDLIDQAVKHPDWCNDYKGVWHDILWMSRMYPVKKWETGRLFQAVITGTGRKRKHTLKIECGPGDDGEPVLTIMLPEED